MEQKNLYVLDENDNKAVEIFTKLGMPKNIAKTLLYIHQFDECRSADIERGIDLRQPEVNVAMRELKKRGWIKKRNLKKKGKGRPVHIYKHSMQLSEILKIFEQEKLKEFEDIKKDIAELKNLIEIKE